MYLTLLGVVLLAAVVSFLAGWLWYSPKLFGNVWMKELGYTKESMGRNKKKMMQTMVATLIGEILKAFFLLFLSVGLGLNQFFLAFIIWIGFVIPVLLAFSLYEKRSWKLFYISAGYQFVSLLLMGLIFYFV